MSTQSAVNTTPDARVSRVAKRRTRLEVRWQVPLARLFAPRMRRRFRRIPPPPSSLRAPRPGRGWQDPTAVLVIFTLSRAGRSGGVPLRPHPLASPKHDTRAHIYRHTDKRLARYQVQTRAPQNHRDAKNECAQTWSSLARIIGGDAAPWMFKGLEELRHFSLS